MSGFLVINDEQSIDFKLILDDYRGNFVGRQIRITTNYNLLSEVNIVFSEKDLPHLMGWDKVISKHTNSGKIIWQVDHLKLTKKIAKKNSEWFRVKKRMLSYNILSRIFLDQDITTFVATSDMHPNRLRLDIVFIYNGKYESIVFGLRKTKDREFFVPTTLHTEKLDNQYNRRRLTKITSLEWVN
jgi:hypothetical protein